MGTCLELYNKCHATGFVCGNNKIQSKKSRPVRYGRKQSPNCKILQVVIISKNTSLFNYCRWRCYPCDGIAIVYSLTGSSVGRAADY